MTAEGTGTPLRQIVTIARAAITVRLARKLWRRRLLLWGIAVLAVVLRPFMLPVTDAPERFPHAPQDLFALQMALVLAGVLVVVPAVCAGAFQDRHGDGSAGDGSTGDDSDGDGDGDGVTPPSARPLVRVLGALCGSWAVGMLLVLAALPGLAITALLGAVDPLYAMRLLLVIALFTPCLAAVVLGIASLRRGRALTIGSGYVLVLLVAVAFPVLWTATDKHSIGHVSFRQYVPVEATAADGTRTTICEESRAGAPIGSKGVANVMLWTTPWVMLSQAAPPFSRNEKIDRHDEVDPLIKLRYDINSDMARVPPLFQNQCSWDQPGYPHSLSSPRNQRLWPMGFGLWGLAGASALGLATWRLGREDRKEREGR